MIRSDNILYSLLPTFFVDYSVLDGQHDVESVVCALCKDEKIYEHRLDHENMLLLPIHNHASTSSLEFYGLVAFPDAQLTVLKQ